MLDATDRFFLSEAADLFHRDGRTIAAYHIRGLLNRLTAPSPQMTLPGPVNGPNEQVPMDQFDELTGAWNA